MTKPKYRFSIVIPAYNEAHYIADTIDSLHKQSFDGSYEIIVVDNNCTDQTATIAKSLGAKVVVESHAGVCWARQAGTEAAQGEIVVSTDADTVFHPDWLKRIDVKFRKNPKIVAVTGSCKFMNAPLWGELYTLLLFGGVQLVWLLTHRTYYASATNIAFKKEVWEGYDTMLTQGGDELDLLRNLRKKGKVIYFYKNPTYTSARRMVRGFLYNFFVTFFVYYFLEYNLSRLFKRPVIGSYPKFRNELSPRVLTFVHIGVTLLVAWLFSVYTRPGHYVLAQTQRFIRSTQEDVSSKIPKFRK